MYKTIAAAAVAATLAFSANAADIYKDYTLSKEVSNVTFVKVNPGKFNDYLDGLRQTWLPGCEIGKKLGTIVSCSIWASETMRNQDFNMILVMTRASGAVSDPDEAMYNKFMAEMRAKLAEDKQNKIVEGYSEMRSFFGEQDFRQVKFK
jgi:hypothetical protein